METDQRDRCDLVNALFSTENARFVKDTYSAIGILFKPGSCQVLTAATGVTVS